MPSTSLPPTFPLLILYIVAGLLLLGLSIPLIRGRVKPNAWYGFRTPKTLRDERVWYAANTFAGRALLPAGAVSLGASILFYLIPALRGSVDAYALACAAVILVSLNAAIVACVVYLRRL